MLEAFLRHRREVVTRAPSSTCARRANAPIVLEGLAVALANIDEMIALIKASPAPAEARER
jgi:DNA gyrase subunit A